MPPTTPRAERARFGSAKRWHGADSPQARDARRDLAAANIASCISKQLAAAPPLEPRQVGELTALLVSGTGGAA